MAGDIDDSFLYDIPTKLRSTTMAQGEQDVTVESRDDSPAGGKFLRGGAGWLQLCFKFVELVSS